jgi:predicted DNA-binding transcriptional regulator AlpA
MSVKPQTRYLRFRDLKERGIVSNWTTLGRWMRNGRFPKPVRLGPNSSAWILDEVDQHERRLVEERDAL